MSNHIRLTREARWMWMYYSTCPQRLKCAEIISIRKWKTACHHTLLPFSRKETLNYIYNSLLQSTCKLRFLDIIVWIFRVMRLVKSTYFLSLLIPYVHVPCCSHDNRPDAAARNTVLLNCRRVITWRSLSVRDCGSSPQSTIGIKVYTVSRKYNI